MTSLSSASESIELNALTAIHQTASPELQQRLGLQLKNIGGIICSTSSKDPSILINRCFVSDNRILQDHVTLQKTKDFYSQNAIKKFFLHVTNPSQQTSEALSHAGFQKARSWMKFSRDTTPHSFPTKHSVKQITSEHAEHFARIVAPCFDLDETSIPLIASMINHPNWHLFMAFDGDLPAATGALFYENGIGYCDWGATHRDYRQRGFQGALLAARVNAAIAMGAGSIITATGEEVPGDPQHSYKNILRSGFKENYLRENWVPTDS
ncbi:hypothetical protein NBRC116494_08520 [Aurantivibrio plasticivorans]